MTVKAQPGMGQGQMQLSAEQQKMVAEMQQKQTQLQKTQQALQSVQTKVIEESPALQKQRNDLRFELAKQMNKGGYDVDAEINALNAMAEKYQNSDKKPSAKEIQEFRQREAKLKSKQAQAWQNPKVQNLAQAFENAVMTKVKAHSSESSKLVQKLEMQMNELQQFRQQLQQSIAK